MQTLNRNHLLRVLFFLAFYFSRSISQETPSSYCGNTRLQEPFFHENSTYSPLLKNMVLCKSHKLYFRTTLGLFQISSIDYANKLLTISHSSCSSTSHFVSSVTLSAGFPNTNLHNSLLLYNCCHRGDIKNSMLQFIRNCTQFNGCGASDPLLEKQESAEESGSCLVVDDIGKLGKDFHPKRYNCTHYDRVYKEYSDDENTAAYLLGTRISFDIPDHVPNPCNECRKPDGNCGVGLKCICHLRECKDKVVSPGVNLKPSGRILFSLLFFILWWIFSNTFDVVHFK